MIRLNIYILQLFLKCTRVMDKQQPAQQTLCKFCGKFILTTNIELHEFRCEFKSSRASRKNQQKEQQSKYRKQYNTYNQLHEEHEQNKPIPNKSKRQSQPERRKIFSEPINNQQRIPCSFCGYMQTLSELDSHPSQCISMQKRCQYCDQLFPVSIMTEHHQVCDKKKSIPNNGHIRTENNYPNFEDYQYSDEGEEDEEALNPFGNFRTFFSPSSTNRRPSRGGRTIRIANGRTIIEQDDGQGGFSRREIYSNNNNPLRQGVFEAQRPMQRRGNGFQQFFRMLQIMALNGGEVEEGLTKNQLKKIKKIKYKAKPNTTQKDLCTICYCEFQNNQSILQLKCKHIYHEQCIVKWLQKNIKCPVCKAPQTDREVHQEE